jgi:hypothetical protein
MLPDQNEANSLLFSPLFPLRQPSIYPKKPVGISVVRNYLKIGATPLNLALFAMII